MDEPDFQRCHPSRNPAVRAKATMSGGLCGSLSQRSHFNRLIKVNIHLFREQKAERDAGLRPAPSPFVAVMGICFVKATEQRH